MFESHVPVPQNLQLKTCPFCSGEARLFVDFGRDGLDAYFAGCAGNGCIIRPITLTYATKRDAIRAWNWRKRKPVVNPSDIPTFNYSAHIYDVRWLRLRARKLKNG